MRIRTGIFKESMPGVEKFPREKEEKLTGRAPIVKALLLRKVYLKSKQNNISFFQFHLRPSFGIFLVDLGSHPESSGRHPPSTDHASIGI
jgi:hypothetical protein